MDDYKTRMNEEVALMHKERMGKYPGLSSWRHVKSYDEIFKLEAMLKAEGIPFVYLSRALLPSSGGLTARRQLSNARRVTRWTRRRVLQCAL